MIYMEGILMKYLINKSQLVFDRIIKQLLTVHPFILMMFIAFGMPLMILLAVAIFSTLIVSPVAFMCGWL